MSCVGIPKSVDCVVFARGSTHTRQDGLRVAPCTSPHHARSTSVASVGRPAVLPCSAKPCRYESPTQKTSSAASTMTRFRTMVDSASCGVFAR